MNKWLFQLVLVISSVILISGCSHDGSVFQEEETDDFFDALPTGKPIFLDIIEPYFNTSTSNDDSLSLFSYKPLGISDEGGADETEILSSDSNLIITLNTAADNFGNDEYTVLSKHDSIYLVNHGSNEVRLLNHFSNKVCEIIPVETVIENLGHPTVVHDELVYIVIAEDSSTADNDCTSGSRKRFYELPLDHQLDASLDDDDELNRLDLVTESVARSQLILGWVEDENTVGKDVMEYAYLGYDSETKKLSLFDENKNTIWSQSRVLQAFDVVNVGSGKMSSKYLFHVQELENQQYLIQLGLDVFVIDSGLELLSKSVRDTDTILTDKVLTVTAKTIETNSASYTYALPVRAVFDHQNLILIDDAKLYRLLYQVRDPSQSTKVIKQKPTSIDNKDYLSQYSFSQFDLKVCEPNDLACESAHDIAAQSWQFLTQCDVQYGCEISPVVANYCQTLIELQQSQSLDPLCTASDYQHLAELNNTNNDAELLAYMQYANNYVNDLDFSLQGERLYIVARMEQKDILLAYNFNIDFSAAKSLREHVFFGKQSSLTGLDAYFINDSLFLTALEKGAIRNNECYKNSQKVLCDLGNIIESDSSASCTGVDLARGSCVNQFREYESKAFFCLNSQLVDLSCSDSNLGSLVVEADDEDAKWLKLYDYRESSQKMYLLAGNHIQALDTGNLDEGKLYNPVLYSVDQASGQKDDLMTTIHGAVESVTSGWISKDSESGMTDKTEVFGHINLISQEIEQTSGFKTITNSSLVGYLLEQAFEDSDSMTQIAVQASLVSEITFERSVP